MEKKKISDETRKEEEYEARKEQMCRTFSSCAAGCPLFEEAERQGIHGCGTLCEILRIKQPETAEKIVSGFLSH